MRYENNNFGFMRLVFDVSLSMLPVHRVCELAGISLSQQLAMKRRVLATKYDPYTGSTIKTKPDTLNVLYLRTCDIAADRIALDNQLIVPRFNTTNGTKYSPVQRLEAVRFATDRQFSPINSRSSLPPVRPS